MRSVLLRPVLRALCASTAVILAVAGPLAATVPSAQAARAAQAAAASPQRSAPALAMSITGMTPTVASPGATVTVTGTLANRTGAPVSGITVQAETSTEGFQYPAQMTDFTSGTSVLPLQPTGGQDQVAGPVPDGATARWSVSFPAGPFYGQFGVFPVEVQAASGGAAYQASARTFLPFLPGDKAAQPKGLQVAWVWPLIDTPQQGACSQTLATSELAGSVASGGRLSTLLGAGSSWAKQDQLTWDIDPALLSDVSVMTGPYFTHGKADCSGRFAERPSAAAGKWLSQLKAATAGAPAFLAPYADVDAAALSHSGLDGSLASAYRLGDTVAGQIMPGTFGKNGSGTGDGQVLKAAWPADGQADAGVLTSLAQYGGISTVVLSSDELPLSSPGEDALARTVSGVGTGMSVLLANSRITSLLGGASAASSPSGQFALTQDFLAQTAMIAAELPGTERSLVIAPPPNWDPSPAEANALLSITHSAPWLHATGLSALAAKAAKLPATTRVPPKQVDRAELGNGYLSQAATVTASVSLFKNILSRPAAWQLNMLDGALAATESSAWRGRGLPGGWRAMGQLTGYLRDSENKVTLIVSKKILLAGQSGETAVSVQNGLGQPVRVQVTASTPLGSGIRVGPFDKPLTVPAGGSNTVRMPVHSSMLGTTTVRLQLATPAGAPLSWTAQSLSVEVTRVGRFLLVVIGGALGILVLTSVLRLRRKRRAGARRGGTNETAEAGGTG